MSESPTGDNSALPASNEPTGQQPEVNPAESQNQETTPQGQPQGAVSDDESAQQQTQKQESGTVTDDGLAKFAKSQGIDDVSQLDETAQRLLKVAHDNQKAARSQPQPKVTETVSELTKPADDATDVQKLSSKVQQMEYESTTNKFWSEDGRDRTLEPTMVQTLKDKAEKFGKEYAFALSRDLDTLYKMAQLESGNLDPNNAKEEGRREAITSIKKAQTAAGPQAHASQQQSSNEKIDAEWVQNTYDPTNPEHVKMLDSYMRGDLY